MLQFSKRLVSKGLKATLALTVHLAGSMQADPSSSIDLETISDGHDLGGFMGPGSIEAYQTNLRVVGSRTLAELIHKLDCSGRPLDAVIYDGFLPWALDVAKQCRGLLPLPLPLPLSEGSVRVPGLPPLKPWEAPSYVYKLGLYPAFYDMVINQSTNVDDADFCSKTTLTWRSRTTQYYLLDKRLPNNTAYGVNLFTPTTTSTVSAWLHRHPPRSVVYVSFGSMADLDPSQFAELAHGLALASHPFIWIIRSTEQHKLPRDLMDLIPSEEALILPWCNQLEVLESDAIGCFVTHCGLNSVIEAICLGVPMFVEDVWRVGVKVRVDEAGIVGRKEVERCVREVVGGGGRGREVTESARRWMETVKAAMAEGGSLDQNIDEFVEKLVSRASTK
ncbi:hypothetical protein ACJRO7_030082 [Eucalyptus globulus]|uniref:Glycosyltransferase n=1 Tax=Eucalyptus globulus TaxID=34317 RepID=A0ABD3JDZ1_EUCGL